MNVCSGRGDEEPAGHPSARKRVRLLGGRFPQIGKFLDVSMPEIRNLINVMAGRRQQNADDQVPVTFRQVFRLGYQ